ncbi:uncharacterized protein LOC123522892 [Mercenaria mercenaria]|uniref:uncharacterized protein LOC123522892 n=1 Tax=Mercenaria mercenaria TaxID=6596 RepID=UPI00234E7664|nr:uncharacterized protein LOC123522892 [Mercenaria mercenaria]
MEIYKLIYYLIGLMLFVGNCFAYDPAACIQCRESHMCNPPDCFCCRDKMPLNARKIPQMVFFSFDDAVNPQVAKFYRQLFSPKRLNPNGCPISMTLFVSHRNTVYSLVKDFYQKGIEIASHSVTHAHMNTNTFIREARKQKENLSKRAGIPSGKITGWRSPFLEPVGDLQPSVLKDLGYEYDATLTMAKKGKNDKAITPFTLDFGWPYDCKIKPCPTKSHNGFWEVPVVTVKDYLNKYDCVYVDGCNNPPPTENLAYKFLWDNFQKYYTTNRAPMGINMHASWFYYPDRKAAMDRFIKQLVKLDDVYIVSIKQVIEWLKAPTSLRDIKTFQPWQCNGNTTSETRSKPSGTRQRSRDITFRPRNTHVGNFISNVPHSSFPVRSWQTPKPRIPQSLPTTMQAPKPPMVPSLPMVRFWWRPPGVIDRNIKMQEQKRKQELLKKQKLEKERLRRIKAEEEQARLVEQKRQEKVRQQEQARILEQKRQEKLRQQEQAKLLEQQRQEKLKQQEQARLLEQKHQEQQRQQEQARLLEQKRKEMLRQKEQARLQEQQRQEKLKQEEQARLLEQKRLEELRQQEQARLLEQKRLEELRQQEQAILLEQQRLEKLRQQEQAILAEQKRQEELKKQEQAKLLEQQRQQELKKQELAQQAAALKSQKELERKRLEEFQRKHELQLQKQRQLVAEQHQKAETERLRELQRQEHLKQQELEKQRQALVTKQKLANVKNIQQNELSQKHVVTNGNLLQNEFLLPSSVTNEYLLQNEFLQMPSTSNGNLLQNQLFQTPDTTKRNFPQTPDLTNQNLLHNEFLPASVNANGNVLQNEFYNKADTTGVDLLQSEFLQTPDVTSKNVHQNKFLSAPGATNGNLLQNEFLQTPDVTDTNIHQNEFLPVSGVTNGNLLQNEFLQTPDVTNTNIHQNEFLPVSGVTNGNLLQNEFLQTPDVTNTNIHQNEFFPVSGVTNGNLLQNEFLSSPDATKGNLLQNEFLQAPSTTNNNLLQNEFLQPTDVTNRNIHQSEFLSAPGATNEILLHNEFLQTPDVTNTNIHQNEFLPVAGVTNGNLLQNEFLPSSDATNGNLLQNEFLQAPDVTNIHQNEFSRAPGVTNKPVTPLEVQQPLIQNLNFQKVQDSPRKSDQRQTDINQNLFTQTPPPTTFDPNEVLEKSFKVYISRKLDDILGFRPSERTNQLELLSMDELRALQAELRNRLITNKQSNQKNNQSENISAQSVNAQSSSDPAIGSQPMQNEIQTDNKPVLREFHVQSNVRRTKIDNLPPEQLVAEKAVIGLETFAEPVLAENASYLLPYIETTQATYADQPAENESFTTVTYQTTTQYIPTTTTQYIPTELFTTQTMPPTTASPTTTASATTFPTTTTQLMIELIEYITQRTATEQLTTKPTTSTTTQRMTTTTIPPTTPSTTTTEQSTITTSAAETTTENTTSHFTTTAEPATTTTTTTTETTTTQPTVSTEKTAIPIKPMWTISEDIIVPWQRWVTRTPGKTEFQTTTPRASEVQRPSTRVPIFTVKNLKKSNVLFNEQPIRPVAVENNNMNNRINNGQNSDSGVKPQPTAFVNAPKHFDINTAYQPGLFGGINVNPNRFLIPMVAPVQTPSPKIVMQMTEERSPTNQESASLPASNKHIQLGQQSDNTRVHSVQVIAKNVANFANKFAITGHEQLPEVSDVLQQNTESIPPPDNVQRVSSTQTGRVPTSKECIQEINCMRPNCVCKTTNPPEAIKLENTPQIVYITIDGSLNFHTYGKMRSLFSRGRKNPNGCRIKGTVFITDTGSSYRIANVLKTDGIELAMMGVSSRPYTDSAKLRKDLLRQRKRIAVSANLALDDVIGWRSPGLSPVGDEQYNILANQSLYDSSLLLPTTSIDKPIPWPHTLDFGWKDKCQMGQCPKQYHSGVWEVPAIPFNGPKNFTSCEYIDACTNQPESEQGTVDYLMKNFNEYYKTNRAPFAIRLKQMWFHWYYRENFSGLLKFLDKILSFGDVYVTSISDMLEWMKTPKSLKDLKQFDKWKC